MTVCLSILLWRFFIAIFLLWFSRKSQTTTRDTVNIEVVDSIYICSFYFIFNDIFKIFFLLLGKDPMKDWVQTELTYLLWFLRKFQVAAGDTVNSRWLVYFPKKVLVEKDANFLCSFCEQEIYIKNCSRARLNLPGDAGPFPFT